MVNIKVKEEVMMIERLRGVFVPLLTPFTAQELDIGKLASNVQKLNRTKVAGYMPLGSNGEFSHMSDSEQLLVAKTVKENSDNSKVLIIGIARQSAYSTIEFGKMVQDIGIDFVSVLCPSYYASYMTDAALIKYYTAVADALDVPVLMYNCPKYAAGVTISPDVVRELSAHPNILGIKDTSRGNIGDYLSARKGEFQVLAGSINNFFTGLRLGASGGVLSMANYLPDECCRIYFLFQEGKVEEAEQLSNRLTALNKAASGQYGVAGVKAAADLFGYEGGEVRVPLANCDEEQRSQIKQEFVAAGYL